MSLSSSISRTRRRVSAAARRRRRRPRALDALGLHGLLLLIRVVPHVLRLRDEDHVLGDVGRVVGDPLQVPADQDEAERALDRPGVGHHVGEELAEHLVLELVHLVVALEHVAGVLGVLLDERVERVADHLLRDGGHPGNVDERLERRLRDEHQHALRDVDRLVADPLEVRVDLHGRGDEPQVHRERGLGGEQLQAAVVDVHLEIVDLLVGGDDPLRVLLVAVDEGVDRAVHALLHQPPHGEELVPQVLQLGFEVVPFHPCLSLVINRNGP